MQVPPRLRFSPCTTGLPNAGMWKCDPVFIDLNADGALDLSAVARKGDGPHTWLGDGRGHWKDSSGGLNSGPSSCGGGLSFGDVNGDGFVDLVQADHCHGVFVYLGDGKGHWQDVVRGLYPRELVTQGADAEQFIGAEDVDIGDLNGDGFVDLVTGATDEGGINVYLGDGTGRNWKRVSSALPTTGSVNRVLLVDVNEEGHLDLVATYSPGPRVWLGDGNGGWAEASKGLPSPIVGGLYRGIAVGDINEDGRPDLAAANWVDGPEVYLQEADGAWVKTPDVFPEMRGGAVGLALGDVDRDGHLDLVVSGRLSDEVGFVYGVFLHYGDGAGNWTWSRGSGLPQSGLAFTWGVAVGDVTADGILEIAAGSGGIVGTGSEPGPTEPTVTPRVLVWCAESPSGS